MPSPKKTVAIKKSGIKGAGLGLFAKAPFRKGDRIVEYKGKRQPWKEVKDEDGHNGYLLRLDRSTAVNAIRYKKSPGRYANDANGLTRVSGLRNNAEYLIYGKRCYLHAMRPIAKGEEILVGYGREFWALKRKISASPGRIRAVLTVA